MVDALQRQLPLGAPEDRKLREHGNWVSRTLPNWGVGERFEAQLLLSAETEDAADLVVGEGNVRVVAGANDGRAPATATATAVGVGRVARSHGSERHLRRWGVVRHAGVRVVRRHGHAHMWQRGTHWGICGRARGDGALLLVCLRLHLPMGLKTRVRTIVQGRVAHSHPSEVLPAIRRELIGLLSWMPIHEGVTVGGDRGDGTGKVLARAAAAAMAAPVAATAPVRSSRTQLPTKRVLKQDQISPGQHQIRV